MSKSRCSGDEFELQLSNYFIKRKVDFFDKTSKKRYECLKQKCDPTDLLDSCFDKIFRECFDITLKNVKSIRIATDNEGINGQTADIHIITQNDKIIKLSCKKNNVSVKHQRPSRLHEQIHMTRLQTIKYKHEYQECNDYWCNEFDVTQKFSDLDNEDKMDMYREFNSLVKKYIEQCSSEQLLYFYNFIISGDDTHIIKYDTSKNKIYLYKRKKIQDPTKIKLIKKYKQHINIIFDNDVNIDMRLHNGSSRITKTINLKYDTKISNMNMLYSVYEFDVDKRSVKIVEKTLEKNIDVHNMSVLRYPGGKTRAIKILSEFIPKNINKLYSPFFGGGSFELFVKNNYGAQIIANDKFEPLYNFWYCLKTDADRLLKEVNKLHPITKEQFIQCKEDLTNIKKGKYTRAAFYFAINRSSFSGSTMSGGFSNAAAIGRFNRSAIDRLQKIDLGDVTFQNDDFTDFIDDVPDGEFIFLDPPYYLEKGSKLYGKNGDMHESFDHEGLRDKLANRKNFLLCYNDCEFIRKLYKKFVIVSVDWKYGMNATKKSSEILIMPKEYVRKNKIKISDKQELEEKPKKIIKN